MPQITAQNAKLLKLPTNGGIFLHGLRRRTSFHNVPLLTRWMFLTNPHLQLFRSCYQSCGSRLNGPHHEDCCGGNIDGHLGVRPNPPWQSCPKWFIGRYRSHPDYCNKGLLFLFKRPSSLTSSCHRSSHLVNASKDFKSCKLNAALMNRSKFHFTAIFGGVLLIACSVYPTNFSR